MTFAKFKTMFRELFAHKGKKQANLNQSDSVKKKDDVKGCTHRAARKQLFDRFIEHTRAVKAKSSGTKQKSTNRSTSKREPVTLPPATSTEIEMSAPIDAASMALVPETSPPCIPSENFEILAIEELVSPIVSVSELAIFAAHEHDIPTSKEFFKHLVTIKSFNRIVFCFSFCLFLENCLLLYLAQTHPVKKTGSSAYGSLGPDHIFLVQPVIYWPEAPDCYCCYTKFDAVPAASGNYWTLVEQPSVIDETKPEVAVEILRFCDIFDYDKSLWIPLVNSSKNVRDCIEVEQYPAYDVTNCESSVESAALLLLSSGDEPYCKSVTMAFLRHEELQSASATSDGFDNPVEAAFADYPANDQSIADTSRPSTTKIDIPDRITETLLSVHSVSDGADTFASDHVVVDEVVVLAVANSCLALEQCFVDDSVRLNKNPWIDTAVRVQSTVADIPDSNVVQSNVWNNKFSSVSRSIASYFTAANSAAAVDDIDNIPVYSFDAFTEA
ncbi:hypothetical protein V1512DRAFT_248953 [Lipomyces arxii]|uniref:uncharacterized protein n=1 Tax=Lipomyces arxii TaxID=56418 RepID=UPI0034CDF491